MSKKNVKPEVAPVLNTELDWNPDFKGDRDKMKVVIDGLNWQSFETAKFDVRITNAFTRLQEGLGGRFTHVAYDPVADVVAFRAIYARREEQDKITAETYANFIQDPVKGAGIMPFVRRIVGWNGKLTEKELVATEADGIRRLIEKLTGGNGRPCTCPKCTAEREAKARYPGALNPDTPEEAPAPAKKRTRKPKAA